MKRSLLKAIASDPRLNSDSKVVIFFVAGLGKGEHEISGTQFLTILHHCSEAKKALAIKLGVDAGWIVKKKGGWGSPDTFEFQDVTVSPILRETGEEKKATVSREINDTVTVSREIDDTTRTREKRKRERVVGVVIKGKEKNELDGRVAEQLGHDNWKGFGGALKDYFRDRVETDRQYGYLMTINSWMQGSTAAPKGLGKLTEEDQGLLLTTALNELLAETTVQEKTAYRSSRGMSGNTGVLRSKIEYHLRRQSSGGFPSGSGEQLSIGDPTAVFPEDR
jgi:hypothetical protein